MGALYDRLYARIGRGGLRLAKVGRKGEVPSPQGSVGMAWRAHPLNEPSHLAANPLVLGIPNIDTRRERAYSLVIIRAPVAPEVLGSTPLMSEYSNI